MPDKMEKVEITAAADGYDARREDTASKIVVGHEEIVKYGDTSVLDVLKRLPGVTVSGASGRGEIRMRGLGSGYTQVLVNGERAAYWLFHGCAGARFGRADRDHPRRQRRIQHPVDRSSTINIVLKKTVKTRSASSK
ncbi:TonB-dependent receptor plug domain-containing protein [Massilia sp. B-10]|nr:TonB-dependent receptor plug domain-containing protein [Massilia sp. B-10]